MKNQRKMIFSKKVDLAEGKPEISVSHYFSFDFSKEFIKKKKVLNIGSWTGGYEMLICNYASKIISVDIEKKALAVIKKNLPQVECYKAYSHDLPFDDNTFDVVTLWAVIEHIPIGYELATLKEIKRVLKPGGYLFLSTMNKNFLSNLLDPAYWLVGHRHYTKYQLKKNAIRCWIYYSKSSKTWFFFNSAQCDIFLHI